MSKIAYALTSVFLIEMGLYFFGGTTYVGTSLFTLLLNPTLITTNTFYLLFTAAAAVFAASTIIPGNFININIYAVYAGIITALITYVTVLVHLFTFVYGQLSGIDTTVALIVSVFMCGPLIIFWITTTIDWVRSNL